MEIFELRYFLAVAQQENIHRASEKLRISPASLSKAVSRLEAELGVGLFSREGRGIRLTEAGRLLQLRAAEITRLEEATRLDLAGAKGTLQATLAGPEVLLSHFGIRVVEGLQKKHPGARFEFHAGTDERALEEVAQGEAHLALTTMDVPSGLTSKVLGTSGFVTVAGPSHPLHSRKSIEVSELLEHPFASPSLPLLGKVGLKQSLDGWRDDQFPRKVAYLTTSLSLLSELVTRGLALAYLPDYLAKSLGLKTLVVTGCPYSCAQKIRLVARKPKDVGWLNQLF